MASSVFFLLASLLTSSSATNPPGENFDLSTFYLQIPTDNSKGGITEIKQPQLETYTSSYFYTHSPTNGAMCWAPENGARTNNGAGPRTELSQDIEFTFSGVHEMNFTQVVHQADCNVVIGQVKGDSHNSGYGTGGSCLIVVELTFETSGVVSAHGRDSNCNSVSFKLGTYNLKEKIPVTFKVDGYTVYVTTSKGSCKFDYSFWKGADYQMHFKVGDYLQCSGSSSTKGGKTEIQQLVTSHSS
jgi:hypothetical protein